MNIYARKMGKKELPYTTREKNLSLVLHLQKNNRYERKFRKMHWRNFDSRRTKIFVITYFYTNYSRKILYFEFGEIVF